MARKRKSRIFRPNIMQSFQNPPPACTACIFHFLQFMAKNTKVKPKTTGVSPEKAAQNADSNWRPWVLAGIAFVLFCTGLSNGLLGIDDHQATVDNPAVRNLDLGSFNLGMYAPVTWLGYALAYTLGAENPFWYHLLSALVHAVNVWLAYHLLLRLGIRDALAFTVTLLFAVHPIQVESVAWIAGFSTPLFSMFCLLSALFYLRHNEMEAGSTRHYGLSLLFFITACLAKSTAVMLPLLLLVLEIYWKKPALESRKRWLGYIPYFIIALVFGLFTFYTRSAAGVEVGEETNTFGALERVLLVCYSPLLYWSKLLLPTSLSIYYSFDKVNGSLPLIYYAAPFLLAGVAYAAWHFRQKAPYLLQGLLFYGANIVFALPFYSVGSFELCADHYNYLGAIGIFYLLVSGWEAAQQAFPSFSDGAKWLGRIWLAVLLVLSLLQIRLWKDTIAIVSNAIEKGYHQNGKMYQARAIAYANDRKDLPSAMRDFDKALEINPKLADSYKFRGSLYGVTKQYAKSVADMNKYLELKPEDFEQYYNRGLSLLNLNRMQEAIADFTKTLEADPNFARAYRARGNAYKAIGETAKGEADLAEWERRTGGGQ